MFFLRLSFASFLWSPARSKKKERSHAILRLRGSLCYDFSVIPSIALDFSCAQYKETIVFLFPTNLLDEK